jgi:hypothetical protein
MRVAQVGTCAALVAGLASLVLSAPSRAASEQQSTEELRDTVINLLQALVDQGVLTPEKARALVKQAQDKAAADAVARNKEEQDSIRVPYVPEIVKQEIAKEVEQQVTPQVSANVIDKAKSEGWGIPGALPDWVKEVRLYGELTVRAQADLYGTGNAFGCPPGTPYGNCTIYDYQSINTAGGIAKAGINAFLNINQDRWRMRLRARYGADVEFDDSWSTGFRLASGTLNDPSSESQTVGDEFGRYTVGFDEAWLRWSGRTATKFDYLDAEGGRFLNPFFSPTELVYARELAFDGAAFSGRLGLGKGGPDQSRLFMTLGAFPVQELPLVGKDNKWLLGGQTGVDLRWGEGQRFVLGAAFYDFVRVQGIPNTTVDSTIYNYTAPLFVRHGNSMFDISDSSDPTVNLFALAAEFRVADIATTYRLPIGRYLLSADAEAARNVGFNQEEILLRTGQNIQPRVNGYVVTFTLGDGAAGALGDSSPNKFGQWRAGFGWRYVQRDAVLDSLTDADFHEGGTDAQGYILFGDFGLGGHVWARLRYMPSREIDPPAYKVDIWQLDFNSYF